MPELPVDAPACTRLCGIFLELPEVIQYEQELQRTPEPPCPPFTQEALEHTSTQFTADGRVIVYTDGSCQKTKLSRLRRAGSGCFWGSGNCLNHSAPVSGNQTNQRAELQAAVRAAETDPRQLEIRTDSRFVVLGAQNARARHSHMDLWARLAPRLGRVTLVKVKGHATWSHVRLGFVSAADKVGNAQADRLANAGAEMHPARPALEQKVKEQRDLARAYQKSLVKLLREHDQAVREYDEAVEICGTAVPVAPDPLLPEDGFARRQRRKRRVPS